MKSYFIRHTEAMSVRKEDLEVLWKQHKVAIHYPNSIHRPDYPDGIGEADNESREPEDYPKGAKTAVRTLRNLADEGGYVWAESRVDGRAKVGLVKPQEIKLYRGTWTRNPEYPSREGTEAILKTVQLDTETVKLVETGEAVGLRAGRYLRGTICEWHKCGTRLADLVEGRPVSREWPNLSAEQQEAACAEFLRYYEGEHPRLEFLLLPVGRNLKDVDIYGLGPDGTEVLAQVTYRQPGNKEFREKLKKLKDYANDEAGVKLVYFCRCESAGEEDGVHYIPVEEETDGVMGWVKANPFYSEALFTS